MVGRRSCRFAGFHAPVGVLPGCRGVGRGSRRRGEGVDRGPGVQQRGSGGPVGSQVKPAFALAAGQPGRDVQEPEPQQLGCGGASLAGG